jgi:hypothetical protein
MKKSPFFVACALALGLSVSQLSMAQTVTATTQTKIQITKGASPASLKRKLKEELEIRAVKNLLEASFAIRMTPQIEAKLPELVELLGDSIQISMDPPDGEQLSGKAVISVPSAKLKEYLVNKGIGAGDIAAKSAKILVSIDEFMGVATTLSGDKPVETEVSYSHDKGSFSDTSAKSSGSRSQSASSAYSSKSDVNYSNREAVAVSASQSSSVAARQDTAVAGRKDSAASYQGSDGRAAGASSSQYVGAQSSQYAAAQRSQYSGAASSSTNYTDKSQSAGASSSASASSSSAEQKNIQQQNDKVSYTVKTRMPEFNNAKPLAGQDRVLISRLSGEFQNNGLRLVSEEDLRAEGGRILPYYEINNNGRVNQFIDLIRKKDLNADVWATGQANYTIVGTTPTGTQCNGNLSVQGRFIEDKEIFFEDSLTASATGTGDQDCRARLGIALATQLAKVLGERANKELNARSSRGNVYTLYLYSASSLKRADRRAFQDLLEKVEGLQASEPNTQERYMAINVQYSGRLKDTLDRLLDKVGWEKAEIIGPVKGNKICIGLEGFGACPTDLR